MVNLKINTFPAEVGDLYINNSGRINSNLISLIKEAKVFRRVIVIDTNDIQIPEKKKHTFIRKILLEFKVAVRHYKQLNKNINDEDKYSRLIINGFWGCSTYVLRVLYSKNPKLRITFIDEGLSSYFLSKKQLCLPAFGPWTTNIWYYLILYSGFRNVKKYQKNVDDIYLYQPNIYVDKINLDTKELKIINQTNPLCFNILYNNAVMTDNIEYQSRCVYYFMQNQSIIPDQYKIMNKYLNLLVQIINPNKIIVKGHPGIVASGILPNIPITSSLFIDTRIFFFEAILSKINLNDKLFIARDSSALFYPKYMFAAEPYVIFTYKLYTDYYKNKHDLLDQQSQNLKSMYINKERVHVPESIEELHKIVTELIMPSL